MAGRTCALSFGLAFVLVSATQLHAQELWKGTVKQNSGSSNYTVIMKLSDDAGETEYPELKCGGVLTRVAQTGAYSFYTETITTKGTGCIDGTITLIRTDGAMAWGWVGAYKGQTYVGWSSLTRQ